MILIHEKSNAPTYTSHATRLVCKSAYLDLTHQSVFMILTWGKSRPQWIIFIIKSIFNLWVRTLHHFPTQLKSYLRIKECPKFVSKMSRWNALAYHAKKSRGPGVHGLIPAHHVHTPQGAGILLLPQQGPCDTYMHNYLNLRITEVFSLQST